MLRHSVSMMALVGAMSLAGAASAQSSPAQPAEPSANPASVPDAQVPGQAVPTSADTRSRLIAGQPVESAAPTPSGEVVVTGTRISRPNTVAAAPITSVTSQDIKDQAPLNIEEVLNRLPQVAPDNQQTYSDSDGRQRIKLRNLGFERTLVLIDGKRIGTQNGQDTNIIPVSLLERVDVLTGGASSVYGSDAVAGVVNFILKPDFKGIRLDANYNFYQHNNTSNIVSRTANAAGFPAASGNSVDGGRADLTLTAGTSLLEDRLKVSGFIDYKHADPVRYADRSTAACGLVQLSKDGPVSCQYLGYPRAGSITPQLGAGAGTRLVNNPDGTRAFIPYGTGFGTDSNYFDVYNDQRPDERVNAGGFVNMKFSDAAELYGSGIWFRDKSRNVYPTLLQSYGSYGSTPYQVNCNNPFLSGSQATTLCGAAAGTSALAPVDLSYRLNNVPTADDVYLNKGIRATGGIRGKFAGAWTYDLGGVFARNQQNWTTAGRADFNRLNNALDVVNVNGVPTCVAAINGTDPACVPFDAFSAGTGDRTLMDYLFTGAAGTQRNVSKLYDGQLNITGDLGKYGITSPFAHDGVAVAFGGELRKETFDSTADGPFRAIYGGQDVHLQQHVWEANAEIQAPLVQEQRFVHLLQWNGGFRVSKYNVNPDRFTTWKTEGIYSPVRDITFRASYNKAQRAPTLVESYQASNISFSRQGGSQNDFCAPVARQIQDPNNPGQTITTTAPLASRDVCRATGLPDNLYGSTTLLCPNSQCTVRSGGFTADPETAYTLTYGLILKPRFIKGLIFSVDHYNIKINNSLTYNDDSYYYDGCLRTADPYFCSGFVRAPNGTLSASAASNPTSGFIRAGTTNYYYSISRGYDFQSQYTLALGPRIGRLDFEFNGSLTTFAGGQDSPIQPLRNCTGYFANGCGQLLPRWAHTLRTTYTTPNGLFNASFNWRYTGSLTNANNSGDPAIGGTAERAQTTFYHIAPQSYFDLALTFNIDKRFSLHLIANNLFDKNPPLIANSYDISLAHNNTFPQRYDALGRNIAISTTVNF